MWLGATNRAYTVATSYSTAFPLIENPISEGNRWINGGTTGLDWQDVKTTGGFAQATAASASFNDCIAVLSNPTFTANKHYGQWTAFKPAGYTPPSSHEIELLVAFSISAHAAQGYELDCGYGQTMQAVRWNGPSGNFDTTVVTTVSGTLPTVADGDVIKAIFDSTSGSPVITVFQNGSQVWVGTDTTAGKILTGAPGMGFFARSGTGLDLSKYCISAWAGGNA